MKLLIIAGLFLLFKQSNAQKKVVCFVTSVKGDVRFGDERRLRLKDTILFENKDSIRFFTPGSITFISSLGTFKVSGPNVLSGHGENFFHFAKDVLRLHSRTVPLSSRGDCDCALAEECLTSDPQINERILLVDTIAFPANKLSKNDSGFYFLQWKNGDKIRNKRLRSDNGTVYLTKQDVVVDEKEQSDLIEKSVVLGLCRYINGEKKLSTVMELKLEVVSKDILLDYYKSLQSVGGVHEDELFSEFCSDVYVYFGKPNICSLRKLVKNNY